MTLAGAILFAVGLGGGYLIFRPSETMVVDSAAGQKSQPRFAKGEPVLEVRPPAGLTAKLPPPLPRALDVEQGPKKAATIVKAPPLVPPAAPEARAPGIVKSERAAKPAPVRRLALKWRPPGDPQISLAPAPLIAFVIDDMAVNAERGARVAALPGPLTLAFMPYTRHLASLLPMARRRGHELLVHMPMEPENSALEPGPHALLTTIDRDELRRRLAWNLDRFQGYAGVNNHMGSYFTASEPHMRLVLEELKRRGLFFLDSKTSPNSRGPALARRLGLPYAARDIFLDNDLSPAMIHGQLAATARWAARHGDVIAIGHPHPATIAALERWIPKLRRDGFAIVPVSRVVRRRMGGGS